MKNYSLKFKTIVPLVTLLTIGLSNPLYSAPSPANTIKQLGSFIYKIEQQLANFFDHNNNTSYRTLTNTMKNILGDFNSTLSRTKTRGNTLQQEAHSIAHYARNQFNSAYVVLSRYAGKGKNSAGLLAQELQKQFDLETAFKHIKSKLQTLSAKAKEKGDIQLVATINRFIDFINKKVSVWKKRSAFSLITAISRRLNRQ